MGLKATQSRQAMGSKKRPRGHAGPLSRDAVVVCALDVINREGVERLTIRRLADALGVSPMAIYRHVANKADLLDGALDLLMREADVTAHDEPDWLDWLCETFVRMRVTLLAQSGALALIMSRSSLGSQALGVMEVVLEKLAEHGIAEQEAARVFHHLMVYTLGSVAMLGPILQHDAELADADERVRKIRANFELLSSRQFPQVTRHADGLAQAFRETTFTDELRRIALTASDDE